MCDRQIRTCIFIMIVFYNSLFFIVFRYKLIHHDCNIILISRSNKKFEEELNSYFPLMRQRSHRRRRIQTFFFFFCVCICCRANDFAETLPSNDRSVRMQIHRLMAEMGSGAMLYIPIFIKTGSDNQKFIVGMHRQIESLVIS